MDVVKQLLTEAGVIGGIVDDFDPLFQLDVMFTDTRISLGDVVLSPAQVQYRPWFFEYLYDPAHPEARELFLNPTLVTVVISLNHISPLSFPMILFNIFGQIEAILLTLSEIHN